MSHFPSLPDPFNGSSPSSAVGSKVLTKFTWMCTFWETGPQLSADLQRVWLMCRTETFNLTLKAFPGRFTSGSPSLSTHCTPISSPTFHDPVLQFHLTTMALQTHHAASPTLFNLLWIPFSLCTVETQVSSKLSTNISNKTEDPSLMSSPHQNHYCAPLLCPTQASIITRLCTDFCTWLSHAGVKLLRGLITSNT